jgi:hypothetical protein
MRCKKIYMDHDESYQKKAYLIVKFDDVIWVVLKTINPINSWYVFHPKS